MTISPFRVVTMQDYELGTDTPAVPCWGAKDAGDVDVFYFEVLPWTLEESPPDTITSVVATSAPSGLTVSDTAFSERLVSVKIAGGAQNTLYAVLFTVTAASGRVLNRVIGLLVASLYGGTEAALATAMAALPITAPSTPHQLWSENGTLSVS